MCSCRKGAPQEHREGTLGTSIIVVTQTPSGAATDGR
jgi:hypothetical protein